jgi:hypothetical protein
MGFAGPMLQCRGVGGLLHLRAQKAEATCWGGPAHGQSSPAIPASRHAHRCGPRWLASGCPSKRFFTESTPNGGGGGSTWQGEGDGSSPEQRGGVKAADQLGDSIPRRRAADGGRHWAPEVMKLIDRRKWWLQMRRHAGDGAWTRSHRGAASCFTASQARDGRWIERAGAWR